jgi:hypothetical protein
MYICDSLYLHVEGERERERERTREREREREIGGYIERESEREKERKREREKGRERGGIHLGLPVWHCTCRGVRAFAIVSACVCRGSAYNEPRIHQRSPAVFQTISLDLAARACCAELFL